MALFGQNATPGRKKEVKEMSKVDTKEGFIIILPGKRIQENGFLPLFVDRQVSV